MSSCRRRASSAPPAPRRPRSAESAPEPRARPSTGSRRPSLARADVDLRARCGRGRRGAPPAATARLAGVAEPSGSGVREAPAVPVGVDRAGGAHPHRVVVGVDRTGPERAQDGGSPGPRTGAAAAARPRRPDRAAPSGRRGARASRAVGAVPGRRGEGRHDVAAVGPAVRRQGDHPGEAVLVEHGRRPAGARPGSSSRRPPTASARRRQWAVEVGVGGPGALAGRVAAQATRAPRAERAPVSYMWRRMSAPAGRELTEQLGPDAGDLGRAPGRRRSTARRGRTSTRRAGAPRRPRRRPGGGRRSPAGRTHSSARPRRARGSPSRRGCAGAGRRCG